MTPHSDDTVYANLEYGKRDLYGVCLWFYKGHGFRGDFVRSLTAGRFAHVVVWVNGCAYNTSFSYPSGWYRPESMEPPDAVVRVADGVDVRMLDEVLPINTKFPLIKTLLWWSTFCLFPIPDNCVGTARKVLALCGITSKARTPDDLYEEVTRQVSY